MAAADRAGLHRVSYRFTRASILAMDENEIQMDFNHPLAGTELLFDVTILDVREATADEIAHGHTHGEHGHHH